MTKKDFILIAAVIAALDLTPAARLVAAVNFRDVLKRENPLFKPGRFMKAAGFPLYEGHHTNDN